MRRLIALIGPRLWSKTQPQRVEIPAALNITVSCRYADMLRLMLRIQPRSSQTR